MEDKNIFLNKFNVHSDCYFSSAQKPRKNCQDYCLVGENLNLNLKFLVLSDGCSSSTHSEFGAILLCKIVEELIEFYKTEDNGILNKDYLELSVLDSLKKINKILKLDIETFDATLLISIQQNDLIHNFMFGDGTIIITDINNEIKLIKTVKYDGNAPYYLSYKLNSIRDDLYKSSDLKKNIQTYIPNIINSISIKNSTNDINEVLTINEPGCFIMTSDGIESFYDYNNENKIDSFDIIKELTSIKSRKGEFIKRRVTKMLDNFYKNNIYNSDDLSVCGFMIEEK